MERMCSKMLCLSVFILPCCYYKSESSFKIPLNPGIPTSDTSCRAGDVTIFCLLQTVKLLVYIWLQPFGPVKMSSVHSLFTDGYKNVKKLLWFQCDLLNLCIFSLLCIILLHSIINTFPVTVAWSCTSTSETLTWSF